MKARRPPDRAATGELNRIARASYVGGCRHNAEAEKETEQSKPRNPYCRGLLFARFHPCTGASARASSESPRPGHCASRESRVGRRDERFHSWPPFPEKRLVRAQTSSWNEWPA